MSNLKVITAPVTSPEGAESETPLVNAKVLPEEFESVSVNSTAEKQLVEWCRVRVDASAEHVSPIVRVPRSRTDPFVTLVVSDSPNNYIQRFY
jgi:hypothetical protein